MALVVRCPGCRKKFKWKSGTDLPDECPLCGYETGTDRADDDIVLPAILNRKTKAADQVYRDMERGAEHRTHLAAEVGGGTASDYSSLKITDMKDNLRAGDIAAMPVRNAVTEHMERYKQGGFTGGEAVGYSGAVQTGPFPNAGAKMRTNIQQHHATISQGAAVSDVPAIETRQPGYRRRG
jgi:hypothetical protein